MIATQTVADIPNGNLQDLDRYSKLGSEQTIIWDSTTDCEEKVS